MEEDFIQENKLPKDFDLIDASSISNEENNIVHAGELETWKHSEFVEKAKKRSYLAGIVISAWLASILLSVISFLITGNFIPVIPPVLITVPLCIVLRFYFKSD